MQSIGWKQGKQPQKPRNTVIYAPTTCLSRGHKPVAGARHPEELIDHFARFVGQKAASGTRKFLHVRIKLDFT